LKESPTFNARVQQHLHLNHFTTMVLVSPQEFTYFLGKFASKYPYNEILKTRRQFHVKWLITNKPTFGYPRAGIPRNTGTYTAIPSIAFEQDIVQYLIIHKKAQPVPAKMGEVLDWMHCWGRSVDVHWHSHIVDWFHFLLHHGIHLSDRIVLRDCVEYRMRQVIHMRGLDVHQSIHVWHLFFDYEYHKGDHDFRSLAIKSINFMNSIPPSPAAEFSAPVMMLP
jgi:hypothetical protein